MASGVVEREDLWSVDWDLEDEGTQNAHGEVGHPSEG